MTDWDTIEKVAKQLEGNLSLYKENRYSGIKDDARYSACEDVRILQLLDDEVGEMAGEYVREVGIND